MSLETYSAKLGAKTLEDGTEVAEQHFTAQYDFGANSQELIEKFGDDVVFKNATAQMTTSLYRVIRTAGAVEGATQESIQAAVDAWKPGVITRKTKDPVTSATALVDKMSPEQRQAFIEALKESA